MVREYLPFSGYLQTLQYTQPTEALIKIYNLKEYEARLLLERSSKINNSVVGYREYDNIFDMVFGQFVMLEEIITSEMEEDKKLLELALLVIRKDGDDTFDNTDRQAEEKHKENILNEPYGYVMGQVNAYLSLRDTFINETFKGVFYKSKDEEDDDEDDKKDKKKEDKESVNKGDDNWYWYSLTRTLANEDITRLEQIRMLTMDIAAVEVAYLRHVQVKEEHQRKLDEFKRKAKSGIN